MIDPDFARLMARYNAWQNARVIAAAGPLGTEARKRDRGAFFGSIEGTLNHLLWADRMWMSRFAGTPKPAAGSIRESVGETPDWESYVQAREAMDATITAWAARLDRPSLDGALTWHSGAAGRDVTRPLALLVVHFFNHQTHHRGQVHAMLTAAGARTEDTDLFLMTQTAP